MRSLRTTSQEHDERLLPHVDRLLALADMIGQADCGALHALFEEEYAFVSGELVPHMAAVEGALYDRLEALMGGRHSMAPMREEHAAMQRLAADLGRYRRHVERCHWSSVEGLALRRILYRLHSILKVHLAEEALYVGVLERGLGDEERDELARAVERALAERL